MNERMHKQKEQMRSAQDSIQKPLVPDLEVNKTSRKETCLLMVAITLEPTKISAFGSSRCLRGRLDPLSLPPSAAGEMGHTASDSSPQPTGSVERLKRCVPQGRLRQGPWGGGHPTQTGGLARCCPPVCPWASSFTSEPPHLLCRAGMGGGDATFH